MRSVPLSKGMVAVVDDVDYERVAAFKWHALKRGRLFHAARSTKRDGRRCTIYMHRFLLDAPPHLEVDHRNGNGLDNRRDNLRLATHAENAINYKRTHIRASRYRGVSWYARGRRWRATINAKVGGRTKQIYLGHYKDEVNAARAYDRAAIQRHGEFAVTNFSRSNA